MDDDIMLITKHCKPIDRERMLVGHFKIGTIRVYANRKDGTGLMSDTDEGVGAINLPGPHFISQLTTSFGANIRDSYLGTSGNAISYNTVTDGHIFCSSRGGYNEARHRGMVEGSDEYEKNEEVTSFVVINVTKFKIALAALAKKIGRGQWVGQPVAYGSRDTTTDVIGANAAYSAFGVSAHLKKVAFTKPSLYAVEEEFRFMHVPKMPLSVFEPIFICDYSPRIQLLFRRSIYDKGR
ncbi:hypothetical protein [Phyllobacterium sp. 22552]|uniref:hypothetical protein n=1 Tax=Phyllobacterium sp. 22552 TaxID=3453941 RepID=UPI003F84EDE9